MIKNLTSNLDYSMFAELSVVIFAIVFVSVVIRTLSTRHETTKQQANIVFGDSSEEPK